MEITVVMPNYNHRQYIESSIVSVLSQKAKPKKIIFIDDGSTDGSLEVIRGLSELHDEIEVVENDRNKGVVACCKHGLNLVRTPLVFFIALDDVICNDFFSYLLRIREG